MIKNGCRREIYEADRVWFPHTTAPDALEMRTRIRCDAE